MPESTDLYVIPTVGSSGFFQLREPFNTKIANNVRYTCQGVRRISSYVSNNEDPYEEIYLPNQISEAEYEEDVQRDREIVSLQGETGHWVHVPVRYVVAYPVTNGIPYRSITLSVHLPALEANKDYSHLKQTIENVVSDQLGVNCRIDIIETSRVTLVSKEKHDQVSSQRKTVAGQPSTDRSLYMKALQDLTSANQKIAQLEVYIKDNNMP